jgi:hypothetical protein
MICRSRIRLDDGLTPIRNQNRREWRKLLRRLALSRSRPRGGGVRLGCEQKQRSGNNGVLAVPFNELTAVRQFTRIRRIGEGCGSGVLAGFRAKLIYFLIHRFTEPPFPLFLVPESYLIQACEAIRGFRIHNTLIAEQIDPLARA